MKTFREFLNEDAVKAQKAWQDWMNANPHEFSKGGRFYERGSSEKTSNAAKEFIKTYMKTGKGPEWAQFNQDVERARSSSQPPRQPSGGTQTPPRQPSGGTQTPPRQPSGGTQTPPRQPSGGTQTSPSSTRMNRLGSIAKGLGRATAFGVADVGADIAIDKIKDPKTRETVRTLKDVGFFAATPVTSATLGISGSSPERPSLKVQGTPYTLRKDFPTGGEGEGRYREWLRTGGTKEKPQYNEPSNKIYAVAPGQKPIRVGTAKMGGKIGPVKWGSIAGERRVGTPAQAQSTQNVQSARQVSSSARTYGTTKGSAITGIGPRTTFNQRAGTVTSQGRTANLASTQLVRDPRTGQQRVGDLAYRDGKAVYLARPSVASRDTNLLSRLSRWTNIGGQRERDVASAKQEYRTALGRTQQYQRQLGISPQQAKAQRLPGR